MRTGWPGPKEKEAGLDVRAYGLRERMPPGVIDCHRSLPDWLIIHFHDPAEVRLRGRTQWLKQPALVFWGPGDGPIYGNREAEWTHSWLHLVGSQVKPLLLDCGLRVGEALPAPEMHLTDETFRALHEERSFEPEPDERLLRNLVESWLVRLRRVARRPREFSPALRKVKQRLETRPEEMLSLEQMAELAGLSVSHFCAEFRRQFAMAPGRYQARCRIGRARYLLGVRRQQVQEVAAALGYADAFTFSKAFKREIGVSPREYRSATPG